MYKIIPFRTSSLQKKMIREGGNTRIEEIPFLSNTLKIEKINRIISKPNSILPESTGNYKRPWYMHKYRDNHLMVLQGTEYLDIYCPEKALKTTFIITPNKIYKNCKLYFDGPAMIVQPSGIFYRIINGKEGSISLNFTMYHKSKYNNIKDESGAIYNIDLSTGDYFLIS